MDSHAALIEQSLLALAESGIELRHGLYQRFFAAYPQRRKDFLCPEATSIRMTDETLQILHGIATGQDWVWSLVAELIATHRSYGPILIGEYHGFVDLALAELKSALGTQWTEPTAQAWQAQASVLKAMIERAANDWERILPRAYDPAAGEIS